MISGGLRVKGVHKHALPGAPLVTVVTVVRNGGATLEETILSVVNQTYRNVEYIVVDGASTDGTLDIIRKYEDRIDYWVSEPDRGIYDAMNKGIGLATGEWIVMLNSDDYFEQDACQTIITAILKEKHPVYYAIARVIDSTGNTLYLQASTVNYISKQSIAHQTAFVSRKIYQSERYSLKYHSASDYDFFSRLAKMGISFCFIEKVIVNYRLNGVSDSILGQIETLEIKKKYNYIGCGYYLLHTLYLKMMSYIKKTLKFSIV
ncbi:MAG: glycosyltransferase family 2 protein [Treponematales bacterium]